MFLDFFTHSKINTNNKKRYIEKNVKCYKNIHSWPKYVLCCLKMLSYLNWRMIFWVLVLVYILGNTQNKLLDISMYMDKLTARKKVFYNHHLFTRECRLSEDIDKEYELKVQAKQVAAAEAQTREDDKVFHILKRWGGIQWRRSLIISTSRIRWYNTKFQCQF